MRHGNIIDIMRSLYIHSKRHALPSSTKAVVEALHSAGIPSHLLSNPTVGGTVYGTMGEGVEEAHVESEEEQKPGGEV
jgi:hypothetical protein